MPGIRQGCCFGGRSGGGRRSSKPQGWDTPARNVATVGAGGSSSSSTPQGCRKVVMRKGLAIVGDDAAVAAGVDCSALSPLTQDVGQEQLDLVDPIDRCQAAA
jgi:hypothetical protein